MLTECRTRFSIHASDLDSIVESYFTWCHKQPIALFRSQDDLRRTFRNGNSASLVLAVRALSLRYPPDTMTQERKQQLDHMVETARHQVMSELATLNVEISHIQCLCLLSIIDFNSGRFAQAGLNLSTASYMVDAFDASPDEINAAALLCATRAIAMLRNLQGTVSKLTDTNCSFGMNYLQPDTSPLHSTISASTPKDPYQEGLLRCTSELAQVWNMVRAYVARRPKADEPPPWFPQSDFSRVMIGHYKIDSTVPREFRYGVSRFFDQDPAALQRQRQYWQPWLAVQMMYSAIPCLLNHPYLLSFRLRFFKDAMPQSFIQHSWEQITRHAGWIMHFVDLLENNAFVVTDPAVVHCVVVIATIHLQHSFVEDADLRSKSQEGFEKCLRFVQVAGKAWPIVRTMVSTIVHTLIWSRS